VTLSSSHPTKGTSPIPKEQADKHVIRTYWWTKRAIGLHVTIMIVIPTFSGLFWWQVQRVRQGNTLSWAYVFEWPFFLGYAMYLWWKLVHEPQEDMASTTSLSSNPKPLSSRSADRKSKRLIAREEKDRQSDEELLRYNDYLASLRRESSEKSTVGRDAPAKPPERPPNDTGNS
jgi:hypothetical protein